jgi:heptosyltransferase-1
MKILIVRLSALGDIVHALPVLAAIKEAIPSASVDWLVEENYASILSIASGLRRRVIVRAQRSFESADSVSFGGLSVRKLSFLRAKYDAALDLQG